MEDIDSLNPAESRIRPAIAAAATPARREPLSSLVARFLLLALLGAGYPIAVALMYRWLGN
jgi:hypothetical protein